MRSPEQFQAGYRGPFADRVSNRDQPLSAWEVIGLVGEGQTMPIEACLHSGQGQAAPLNPQAAEQLRQGYPVFHRHRSTTGQHHGQPGGGQAEGKQREQGGRAAAAVVGHAEAEGRWPAAGETGPLVSIALQHASELQGGRTADAVGDQKSPDLGIVNLT